MDLSDLDLSKLELSRLALSRLAPVRLVSRRLAPLRLAPLRLAPVKSASYRLAPIRLAPVRSALIRLAPTRFSRFPVVRSSTHMAWRRSSSGSCSAKSVLMRDWTITVLRGAKGAAAMAWKPLFCREVFGPGRGLRRQKSAVSAMRGQAAAPAPHPSRTGATATHPPNGGAPPLGWFQPTLRGPSPAVSRCLAKETSRVAIPAAGSRRPGGNAGPQAASGP